MSRKPRDYVWPDADIGERLSAILNTTAVAVGMGMAISGWFGWLDIKSNFTINYIVFATSVGLAAFVVEADRRRSATKTFGDLTESITNATAEFKLANDPSSARQIPGPSIRANLDKILAPSESWLFKGGSARYQRGVVLPHLSKMLDGNATYKINILDPRNGVLCGSYAQYRRISRPLNYQLAEENANGIRNEILATLVAIGWYFHHTRVEPSIAFMNSYSPIRIDIGESAAVLTVADYRFPGLLVPRDSFLYRAIKDEIIEAAKVLPKLIIPKPANPDEESIYPSDKALLGPEKVGVVLQAMQVVEPNQNVGVSLMEGLGHVDLGAISELVFANFPS